VCVRRCGSAASRAINMSPTLRWACHCVVFEEINRKIAPTHSVILLMRVRVPLLTSTCVPFLWLHVSGGIEVYKWIAYLLIG
jgi:hypothetical protein